MESTENVIQFPKGRTGCNRLRAPGPELDMARDFLAIANYLTSVAHKAPYPEFVQTLAAEIREIALDVRSG